MCDAGFGDCTSGPGCETNVDTDDQNCGVCGKACKPGSSCSAGACVCNPTTPRDCGADCRFCCGDADCSDGDGCTNDVCASGGGSCTHASCGAGTLCCGQQACYACCADGDCTGGKVCSGHVCIAPCTPPQVSCGGQCVDPTSDAGNCGVCGNACGTARTCSSSICTPAWVALATSNQPTARWGAATAWADGIGMFVWGGNGGSGGLGDGGVYDPVADRWSQVTSTGAPSARRPATAVWTGAHMFVWGGTTTANVIAGGARYTPSNDAWASVSTTNAPTARSQPVIVWTGSRRPRGLRRQQAW